MLEKIQYKANMGYVCAVYVVLLLTMWPRYQRQLVAANMEHTSMLRNFVGELKDDQKDYIVQVSSS